MEFITIKFITVHEGNSISAQCIHKRTQTHIYGCSDSTPLGVNELKKPFSK